MSQNSMTPVTSDRVICRCLNVRESTVRDCVTLLGAETLPEVKASCGAGSGCMSCRRRIIDLIKSEQERCQRRGVQRISEST